LCPALQKKPVLPGIAVAQEGSHPLIPNAVASYGGVPKKDPFSPPYIEGLFLGHLAQEEDTEEEFVALVMNGPLISVSRVNFLLSSLTNTPLFRTTSSSSQRVRVGTADGRLVTHCAVQRTEFAPQTTPLTPDQLSKSYQLLQAANRTGKKLLSFFNCKSDPRFGSSVF